MAQADSNNNTRRRDFLALTAAAATVAMARPTLASPPDDSELLRLEEQFFKEFELGEAYNDEIYRLSDIWQLKSQQLYNKALSREAQAGTYLTPEERWALVTDLPECKEHTRLARLQEVHDEKADALVKQMWAIPALSPEGRRAKVLVALRLLPSHWRVVDEDADYGVLETRQLLIEFIGGEPGEQMRDQFA